MAVLHTAKKGGKLDKLEKFYIFREERRGNSINDKLTIRSNPIFETLIPSTTYKEH
jgi:hypothetical protein